MDNKQQTRFAELDILRGLAIIGMIIFHIFFILNFYKIYPSNMYGGGFLVLARIVQFTFIGLVGVSMAISKKPQKVQIKRGLFVLLLGFFVTFVTYLTVPQAFVRFGILHLIGTSIIILSFTVKRKYINLVFAIIAVIIGLFIRDIETTSNILYAIGLNSDFGRLDYFPIFPWISVSAFGIFIGHTIYSKGKGLIKENGIRRPVAFIGQHSLIIYMTHIPIILIVLLALNLLNISQII